MLVNFSLENHKSFKDQQTLSLVSSAGDEHIEHTLLLNNGLRINRFCALIGGNGVGKTQLIFAINMLALSIHNDDYSTLYQPFSLSKESREKPTSYEVIILDENKEHFLRYGVSVLSDKILEEYLYSREVKKGAKEVCIFSRDNNGVTFKKQNYKKHEALIKPILKETGSVLTFSNSLKAEELSQLKTWALRQLPYSSSMFSEKGISFFEERFQESDHSEQGRRSNTLKKELIDTFNEFIKKSPLHIDGVNFAPFGKEGKDHFIFEVNGIDGEIITITPDMRYEFFSEGTMNILTFIAAVIWSYRNGATLYVDEIDSSIHHSLAATLIKNIIKSQSARDDMQLIISTHNIPLLDECFRRDEINIISKDANKKSTIINASHFSIRKDAKISAKYFRGEFGVLPGFLGM
ncbi:AAA family ATPase [Erwinia rhapontici]|uniref:AAA family ATPase n=1 Tax=Erwinia rhapontici TaxID=55212 RepID=UPI003B9F1467